jgi:propionyl-CoA synthetase
MNHIMDIHQGDTYFAASDIGWVVGHSFTIYGPLLRAAATLLYEGKPTLPNPGALWAII